MTFIKNNTGCEHKISVGVIGNKKSKIKINITLGHVRLTNDANWLPKQLSCYFCSIVMNSQSYEVNVNKILELITTPKTSRHSCGNRSYLEYCITYNLQRGEIESTILSISVERHNFSNSKKNLKADLSNHFIFEFLCFRVTALCFECLIHWKEKFIITTLKQRFSSIFCNIILYKVVQLFTAFDSLRIS
ncbi:hypothetical protein Avbf_05135 [Armadillidium vulgare]|nr:hypothetical protein Avbf_05135 [Armadillidium vulgare]